jgi:TolB-like protein/cytochrome c-type biogenesis protein CcmH/NrfG
MGFLLAIWPCDHLIAQCPDGTPPPCRGARPAATTNTVAVLYFDNASRDTADAYLADGITEEIISRLGQVGGRVQVKSRYAVRRYRGAQSEDPQTIGRQLAVTSIVTGSVRRAGNRLRVTAEMVRTASGDVMWSERYDRAETDVLSLQEDLASAVATAIAGRLLPAEARAIAVQPTRNAAAWDHFLRGNASLAQRTSAAYARALSEYETAARLDPGFSRALARIAFVYGVASWRSEPVSGLRPDSSWRLARAAADRALRSNASQSDNWLALGLVQVQLPESVGVARASLEHALALDSGNAEAWHVYGWALIYQGRDSAGVAAWHRALAIEPGRPITVAMLGLHEGVAHHWAEAERWFDSALVLDPGFVQARRVRALARLAHGDTTGTREDLRAGVANVPLREFGPALVAARTGDSAQLRAEVARQLAMPDSLDDPRILNVASGLLVLGESGRALDLLQRTRWKNTNFYVNMLVWPFDTLRGDPRYERMLDEWRVPAGAR